jgi:hypothetical protein
LRRGEVGRGPLRLAEEERIPFIPNIWGILFEWAAQDFGTNFSISSFNCLPAIPGGKNVKRTIQALNILEMQNTFFLISGPLSLLI